MSDKSKAERAWITYEWQIENLSPEQAAIAKVAFAEGYRNACIDFHVFAHDAQEGAFKLSTQARQAAKEAS